MYEGYFYASKPGNLDYAIEFMNEKNQIVLSKNTIEIQESQIELNKVYLKGLILDLLAKKTNGDFFTWDNRNELVNSVKKNIESIKTKYIKKLIMLRWFFIVLLVLFSLEWFVRKEKGFS